MFYFFNFFYHVGIKKKKCNCLIYYSPPQPKILGSAAYFMCGFHT